MVFFSLGPIETTFIKYTFHKNRFFLSPPAQNDQKMAKNDNKKNLAKIFFGLCWPFLAVFGSVGIEKTIFVKSVFSKSCFYWSKRKKTTAQVSIPKKKILKRYSTSYDTGMQ